MMPIDSSEDGRTRPTLGQLGNARPTLTRPVRVLHLVPQLRVMGGMERVLVKVLNGLNNERIVSAVCDFEPEHEALPCPGLNREVRVHVIGRRRGNDPGLVWRLVRLLRGERPDIVHSHTWGTLCEGYTATRLAGHASFVHGEHGTMELRPRNISVQRWVWSRADALLSVSSRLADRMAREVGIPRERVQVIRNGADLQKFGSISSAEARRGLGLDTRQFVFGTVGRLVPVKGHETLLTALAELRKQDTSALALIAGEGPLRGNLEARANALGVAPAVRFMGDRRDIARVLAALDVFVLTSHSEGLPNTVLEAMAAGLPVVATDVGGVAELVNHDLTGLLVPPNDPIAMAQAVRTLAVDPERRLRFGDAGRTRAAAEFGLARMLADYERLYMTLACGIRAQRTGRERTPGCAELQVE